MAKTRRVMETDLALVDLVCELIDARIPRSSRNPDFDGFLGGKPRLLVLGRSDQADPAATDRWAAHFKRSDVQTAIVSAKTGHGIQSVIPEMRIALKDKINRNSEKGQGGRMLRIMVVGIPNVGKSSLINKLVGKKQAKVEDRPGVTRGRQWFSLGDGLELLDTPGMLWPRFEDKLTGLHLAFTGAIRDDILDIEELSLNLLETLALRAPKALWERYKLDGAGDDDPAAIFNRIAKKRGLFVSGGEIDTERCAKMLLDEFRGGKIGRITLEGPE
jgi:ribosome biogenesis GTPase A